MARLVEGAHEKAKTIAGPVELPPSPKLKPTKMSVSGTFSVQEIAFEIDAFLAASRASIDFGGTVLALHLGMNRRTSVSKVLEFLVRAPKPPFAFLLAWTSWIESLKTYREECVHHRALRTQTGYEAVRRKDIFAVAISPFVFPKVIGQDQPDTRAERFELYRDHALPEGLDKQESLGEFTMNDGTTEVMEHSIRYSPANGYVRVEEFWLNISISSANSWCRCSKSP